MSFLCYNQCPGICTHSKRTPMEIASPKQPSTESKRDWYPYYAGFTEEFAKSALTEYFKSARKILDPWNGSGTTTVAAAKLGIASVGRDVNPAMEIIALARLTPLSVKGSLEPIAQELLIAALSRQADVDCEDPLSTWFKGPAVSCLRQLQLSIHDVLVDSQRQRTTKPEPALLKGLPLLACFYYVALFSTVRDLLSPFRGSNPSWIRYPSGHRNRVNPSWEAISAAFLGRVEFFESKLQLTDEHRHAPTVVETGLASSLDLRRSYDGCLTSPPYATRIDYIRSSLPELAVMGYSRSEIDSLRRLTTGSPVLRARAGRSSELLSKEGAKVIEIISNHPSHGSANYYAPWLSDYFQELEVSLRRTDCVVSANGTIGILVQDSHYKSYPIDLQTIVVENMKGLGRLLVERKDFSVSHSMAKMNPFARENVPRRTNTESLLIFRSRNFSS